MTRATELLPIPPRGDPEVHPGLELTQEMRERVEIRELRAPGPPDAPDVRVLLYRPKLLEGSLPAVISMHGGAFCMFRADSFPALDAGWALHCNAAVVSVDYRLAPEDKFPAAVEDCYAVLEWVAENASDLGVDPERIAVAGASAGGALAAALALMARDRGGPRIIFQALMIPVLDDRLDTPSMGQAVGAPGFDDRGARGMWLHYLGDDYDRARTSPYAAPARASSLAGLPPAVIQTYGRDPLRDEGIAYASRLLAEGIEVELVNAPGAYHGAPPLNEAAVARATHVFNGALSDALNPSG